METAYASANAALKARSSVGERYPDAVEVGGSIPPVPTKNEMKPAQAGAHVGIKP